MCAHIRGYILSALISFFQISVTIILMLWFASGLLHIPLARAYGAYAFWSSITTGHHIILYSKLSICCWVVCLEFKWLHIFNLDLLSISPKLILIAICYTKIKYKCWVIFHLLLDFGKAPLSNNNVSFLLMHDVWFLLILSAWISPHYLGAHFYLCFFPPLDACLIYHLLSCFVMMIKGNMTWKQICWQKVCVISLLQWYQFWICSLLIQDAR